MTKAKPAKKTAPAKRPAKAATSTEPPPADGPRLTRAVPMLPCADIARAVEFYAERLGFAPAFRFESHASVIRDEVEIHLQRAAEIGPGAGCRIEVAQLESLLDEMSRQGVVQHSDPGEFTVLDVDGNRITFARDPAEG